MIHTRYAQFLFCNDFEFKSVFFYDPRRLIHVLYVTGKNRSLFLLPALSLVLHLALRPAQKQWEIWWLWYWRPVMGESETWFFLMLMASSYSTLDNSIWVVMLHDYWLASFQQLGHLKCNLLFFRRGSTLQWSTSQLVKLINTTSVVRQ
jgi:hypothetical protein